MFVVLDELNKYAPREWWSPIKGVLLDISERTPAACAHSITGTPARRLSTGTGVPR